MAVALSPPNELPKKGNLPENWRQWRQNFEIYLIAAQIDTKNDDATRALFLHTIGQHGRDIYNDLIMSMQPPIGNNLQELFNMFENHCNPKSNLTYNRYKFFHTTQGKSDPFDKFLSSLQKQSKDCDFGELSGSLMVTQIISGIKNISLRERLLKTDMELNKVIEECRATEKSEMQSQQMGGGNIKPQLSESKPKQNKKLDKNKEQILKKKNAEDNTISNDCKFCGGTHVYRKCPAFGFVCKKCNQANHFTKVCKNLNNKGV